MLLQSDIGWAWSQKIKLAGYPKWFRPSYAQPRLGCFRLSLSLSLSVIRWLVWASSQYGSLREVRLPTWWLASPSVYILRDQRRTCNFVWSSLSIISEAFYCSKVSHRTSPGSSGRATLGGMVHFWRLSTILTTKILHFKSQTILKQRIVLPVYHSMWLKGIYCIPSIGSIIYAALVNTNSYSSNTTMS